MNIQFQTGEPPNVTLTAAERRGLQSTLSVLDEVRQHLEGPLNTDPELVGEIVESEHLAGLILNAGFAQFVVRYAPEQP